MDDAETKMIATQDCKICAFSCEIVIAAINHAVKDQSSLLCCYRVQREMAAAARSHSVEQRQAGCRRPVVGGPTPPKPIQINNAMPSSGSCFLNDELEIGSVRVMYPPQNCSKRV